MSSQIYIKTINTWHGVLDWVEHSDQLYIIWWDNNKVLKISTSNIVFITLRAFEFLKKFSYFEKKHIACAQKYKNTKIVLK
jgi:ATP-dependent protease Clp ATPase subunit